MATETGHGLQQGSRTGRRRRFAWRGFCLARAPALLPDLATINEQAALGRAPVSKETNGDLQAGF